MNNEEREKFLREKPMYSCRFHPTDWFHEVGCPHQNWSSEELQDALDKAKRSMELQVALGNVK